MHVKGLLQFIDKWELFYLPCGALRRRDEVWESHVEEGVGVLQSCEQGPHPTLALVGASLWD